MAEKPQNLRNSGGTRLPLPGEQPPQETSDLDLLDRFCKAVTVASGQSGEVHMHVIPDRLIPIIERQIQRIERRIRLLNTCCLKNLELLRCANDQEVVEIKYTPRILREIGIAPGQQFSYDCYPPQYVSSREFEFMCSEPRKADLIRKKIQSSCFEICITEREINSLAGSTEGNEAICLHGIPWAGQHPYLDNPENPHPIANSKFPSANSIVMITENQRRNVKPGIGIDETWSDQSQCYYYQRHKNRYDEFQTYPIKATVYRVQIRVRNCTECTINPQNKSARIAALEVEAEEEVARLQAMRQKLEESIVKLVTRIT